MSIIEHKKFIKVNGSATDHDLLINKVLLTSHQKLKNHAEVNDVESVFNKYFFPATATFDEHKKYAAIYAVLKKACENITETDNFVYCKDDDTFYLYNKQTKEQFCFYQHLSTSNSNSIKNFSTGGWDAFVKALFNDVKQIYINKNIVKK